MFEEIHHQPSKARGGRLLTLVVSYSRALKQVGQYRYLMDRFEKLADTMRDLSSSIRATMLLQIGATIAAMLAISIGQAQLDLAVEKKQDIMPMVSTINSQLSALERAWAYDSTVIISVEEAYRMEQLSSAAALLVIETLFLGQIQLDLKEDQEADASKVEEVSEVVRGLAQRVNQLRMALPILRVAASQGRRVQDLTLLQIDSYAEYLEFHEFFKKDHPGQGLWTKVCKIAAIIEHVANRLPRDHLIVKVARSERGVEVLKWASDQLIRLPDKSGDFLSTMETLGTEEVGLLTLGLLEAAGEVESFKTPRGSAITEMYGVVGQEEARAKVLRELYERLDRFEFETIRGARVEAERRAEQVEKLEEERRITLPFPAIDIPQRHAWFLLLVNGVMLATLFRLRYRIFELADEIYSAADLWNTTFDTLPYTVVPRIGFGFWAWQLHHDVIGLFGLALVTVMIWCFPAWAGMPGWLWTMVAYVGACAVTLLFWSRFRVGDTPHALNQYRVWNHPARAKKTEHN